jgi:hypothetical protein
MGACVKLKTLILISIFGIAMVLGSNPSFGAVTWDVESKKDSVFDGDNYNAAYDLEYVSAQIFDNHPDEIYFYMDFLQVPKVTMFNDGLGSFAFIGLDYNLDGTRDIRLEISDVNLRTDRVSVAGNVWDPINKKSLDCSLNVFTNIDENSKWIGFKVSRKCISLPLTFDLFAYAEYNDKGDAGTYDYAPHPFLRVNLPGSTSTTPSTSTNSSSGATLALPLTSANSTKESSNFTVAPSNLSSLSDSLLPSVVTVKCGSGSGTGWSADLTLSQQLKDSGFQSILFTNHHVIEECLGSKSVALVLNTGTTVAGQIVSWNETNDVAGIATKTFVTPLQWVGSPPKQGWWVGVLGSPLGRSNVLTTGIISSVNNSTKKFTLTAAINPGNSGGPVFDNTGRVLGLATSKAVLSDGQLAEGFGNAHGSPLLCATVVLCQIESDPWNGKAKFAAGPTPEELAAQAAALAAAEAKAKAEAEAKARVEAEAKQKEEMRNRCIKLNGDLEIALFNAKSAANSYPKSASVFQGIVAIAPSPLACDSINISTFEAEFQTKQKILTTLEISITNGIVTAQSNLTKKTTITCVKGKLTKKVTAVNPKCPTGYKKK